METLPLAARQIEPVNVLSADVLAPDLAVDVVAQADEVKLHAVVVPVRRQRIIFDRAGLWIEVAERALVHSVEPQRARRVEVETQLPDGGVGFEFLKRIFGELERLRIEFGNK